jgi:hypothetical protein
LTVIGGEACFAAPIFSGTGASAWVETLDQGSQQVGSSPAFISTSATVHYTHFGLPLIPDQVPVSASVYAAATPTAGAAYLLEVRSFASSPNPGSMVGASHPWPVTDATANWYNVAATVKNLDGSPLPGSIQLHFRVDYAPGWQNMGPPWGPFGQRVDVTGPSIYLGGAGTSLEPGEQPVQALPNGLLSGTFHMDLPLSKLGLSSQFSVRIESQLPALQEYISLAKGSEIGLALTGVTLPDGTPLEEKGFCPHSRFPSPRVGPPGGSSWGSERSYRGASVARSLSARRGR